MTSIYHQEKEKALCLIHDASENLLDLEYNLPPDYRLTKNERIKLKNILWFISNYKSLYEKCDFENPPFK